MLSACLNLMLVVCLAGPGAVPQRFKGMSLEEIDAFLGQLAKGESSHTERLLKVSSMFLGVPYADSPLGEGPGREPDPDPLISFAEVDCTTFIEQTMALSQASNMKEAMAWLANIRYMDGVVDYVQRKHFMMAQWIPLNQKAGFLEDITHQVGGQDVRKITKLLDATSWKRRRKKGTWPSLTPEQLPLGTHALWVIPIEKSRDLVSRIPPGAILNVVRKDFRSIPVRVSHQGIVVVKRKRRYLRHAGRAGYGKVVDELLDTFLRRNLVYRKWPVEGINLLRVKKFSSGHKQDKNRLE
jgi:hypothetical protein